MLNAVGSTELSVIERIVRGLHTVAKAMEDVAVRRMADSLAKWRDSYFLTLCERWDFRTLLRKLWQPRSFGV